MKSAFIERRKYKRLSEEEFDELIAIYPNMNIHIGEVDELDPRSELIVLSSGQKVLIGDRSVFIYYHVCGK